MLDCEALNRGSGEEGPELEVCTLKIALLPHAPSSQVMACQDLLFRWCVLRIVESNTQSLVKTLDLIKALIDCMVRE